MSIFTPVGEFSQRFGISSLNFEIISEVSRSARQPLSWMLFFTHHSRTLLQVNRQSFLHDMGVVRFDATFPFMFFSSGRSFAAHTVRQRGGHVCTTYYDSLMVPAALSPGVVCVGSGKWGGWLLGRFQLSRGCGLRYARVQICPVPNPCCVGFTPALVSSGKHSVPMHRRGWSKSWSRDYILP